MVDLMRLLMVIAFTVSLFVVSPRQTRRKSRRALRGEVKDVRRTDNRQGEGNV
jgi:hypothetical protein